MTMNSYTVDNIYDMARNFHTWMTQGSELFGGDWFIEYYSAIKALQEKTFYAFGINSNGNVQITFSPEQAARIITIRTAGDHIQITETIIKED